MSHVNMCTAAFLHTVERCCRHLPTLLMAAQCHLALPRVSSDNLFSSALYETISSQGVVSILTHNDYEFTSLSQAFALSNCYGWFHIVCPRRLDPVRRTGPPRKTRCLPLSVLPIPFRNLLGSPGERHTISSIHRGESHLSSRTIY